MGNTTATFSETAERAAWAQAKNRAARALTAGLRKLRGEIAALGYVTTPGHAAVAMREAEIDAKFSLSEINAKIAEQALARNLAIGKGEYEDTYVTAQLAWELKKQGLLDDLDEWLVEWEKNQDVADDLVAREALEIDARKLALLEAKSALDIEMQSVAALAATYDRLTQAQEMALAVARMETITQRLALIPALEAILAEETAIVNERSGTLYNSQLKLTGLLAALIARRIAAVLPLEAKYHADKLAAIDAAKTIEGAKANVLVDKADVLHYRLHTVIPAREGLVTAQGTLDTERRALEAARLSATSDAATVIAAEAAQITGAETAVEDARRAIVVRQMQELNPKEALAEQQLGEAADIRLSAQPKIADAAQARLEATQYRYNTLEPAQQALVTELTAIAQERLDTLSPAERALALKDQHNEEKRRDFLMPSVMDAVEAELARELAREADILPLHQANSATVAAIATAKLTELLPAQVTLIARLAQLSDARYNQLSAARIAVADAEKSLAEAQADMTTQRINNATVTLQRAQARVTGLQQELTFINRRLAIEDKKRELALAEIARMRSDAEGDSEVADYQMTAETSAALTRAVIETGAVPAVGDSAEQGTFSPPPGDNILKLTGELRRLEEQWRDDVRRYNEVTSITERKTPREMYHNYFATGAISGTARHRPPGTIAEHYAGTGLDEIEGSVLEARHKVVSQFQMYQEMWTDMLALLKTEPL